MVSENEVGELITYLTSEQEKIDRLLRPPNKPKKGKKGKPKVVSTNNVDFTSPSLKLAGFSIGKFPVKALVDTGSTHCLMSVNTFRKLSGLTFYPMKIDMRVAGSVLHDNIVGSTTAVISFSSEMGEVDIPVHFLIAHAINGYDAILGATILMNPEMIVAVTPTHLCLTEEYGNFSVALENADRSVEGNHMHCEKTHIPPGVTRIVTGKVSTPVRVAPGSIMEARAAAGAFTILECIVENPVTVHCTVKNCSLDPIKLDPTESFGQIFGSDDGSKMGKVDLLQSLNCE